MKERAIREFNLLHVYNYCNDRVLWKRRNRPVLSLQKSFTQAVTSESQIFTEKNLLHQQPALTNQMLMMGKKT